MSDLSIPEWGRKVNFQKLSRPFVPHEKIQNCLSYSSSEKECQLDIV